MYFEPRVSQEQSTTLTLSDIKMTDKELCFDAIRRSSYFWKDF